MQGLSAQVGSQAEGTWPGPLAQPQGLTLGWMTQEGMFFLTSPDSDAHIHISYTAPELKLEILH